MVGREHARVHDEHALVRRAVVLELGTIETSARNLQRRDLGLRLPADFFVLHLDQQLALFDPVADLSA